MRKNPALTLPQMASNSKILNVTTNRYVKRNQALGRVAECISIWVEEGVSIRDLTLREMVAARSVQARMNEPVAGIEIPGIIFQPPEYAMAATREELDLADWANGYLAHA